MPGASGSSDTSNSPNAAKLKALCESVETLKAERQAIEAEIKGTNPLLIYNLFFFQKDDVTIRIQLLHLHQIS